MGRHAKRWTYGIGSRPHTVTVEERPDRRDGPFQIRVWDTALRNGKGNWRTRSLGHRDKERAKTEAAQVHAALVKGTDSIRSDSVTLGRVLDLYKRHRTPKKSATEQKADERRTEMWGRVLGRDRDPNKIELRDWEAFGDQRSNGTIDARGKPAPEKDQRSVRERTVQADQQWLRYVLSWAAKWRENGRYLLDSNPIRGFDSVEVCNTRRPVASTDRYEVLRAFSDGILMQVAWHDEPTKVRSHLSEVLDLAYHTGRRISAICALNYSDLRLERTGTAPYGEICWPGQTDKQGKEWTAPLNREARAAINRVLADRPGIGDAPLFPNPEDASIPISRHFASKWLREAEVDAKLEPQQGSLWHAFRRSWVTRRKQHPDADVAKAGGWASVHSMRASYQHADAETTLAVVCEEAELREAQ